MQKTDLPQIKLSAKPSGLTFKAPQSAMDRWDRSIQSAAAAPAEMAIDIMGEIGDSGWGSDFTTAAMVKKQLSAAGKSPVRVTLNSPGGDAFEGIAIYNLLAAHQGKVTINVLGLAASAASVIAMAGDTVNIGDAAFLMIHSAWGVVMGNRNDMTEFASTLEQLDNAVAELYAKRSGQKVSDVLAMMEKETWMTGKDAVKLGFADAAIQEDKRAKAFIPEMLPHLSHDEFAHVYAKQLKTSGARAFALLSVSVPQAKKEEPKREIEKRSGVTYL
jgi:ATP-dependent Clp protease protease subunit